MKRLPQEALDQLFAQARTHHGWLDRPVDDSTLHQIYDLMKWGPTSVNGCPARMLFLRPGPRRDPLLAALMAKNVEKTRPAPVTAIIAYDLDWLAALPRLSPVVDYLPHFRGNQPLIEATAFRNGSLQGAYFMLAARALGLDCGPMSGFDNGKVDAAYFNGTSWRSNFVCNLGFGDVRKVHARAPRLGFEEACRIQ
jgi:3-hydroxypropanoate dehydrogenase